jgi:hypothetical protein
MAVGFGLGGGQVAAAQDQKPDVMALILDCMRLSRENGETHMLYWLPEELWKVSAAANPNSAQAQLDTVIKVVHPYLIVGVVSGKLGPFGAVTYRTEPEVRDLIRLKDNEGNTYSPLEEDKLDPSVPAFLALFQPIIGRTAGAMVQHMYFYVFPGIKKDGARICDPMKEGALEVDLGERVFKWRLPLSSLLPKQKCPTCGELLSGAYKYCPYDGSKLTGNK